MKRQDRTVIHRSNVTDPLPPSTILFVNSYLKGVQYSIPIIGILATLIGYCIFTVGTSSWIVVILVLVEVYLISAGVGRLLVRNPLKSLIQSQKK